MIKEGDTVFDRLTGGKGQVVKIFSRDGVELAEVAVGGGYTTTATLDWFVKV